MRYSEAHTEAATFALVREFRDTDVIARFTVDGEPVSKARARFTRSGHSYTPEKTMTAEKMMADAFRDVAPEHVPDVERTFGLTALFFNGTRQRRDVDNMLKLILDGLNKVAWVDDAQVIEVSGRKCVEIPDHARTEVLVYAIGAVQHLTKPCAYCREHFRVYPGSKRLFCSTDCAYAHRRARSEPFHGCAECGEPVKERRATYCSYVCMGTARRHPSPRCAQCGKGLTKAGVRLCRDCFRSPELSTDCRMLRHDACEQCVCVCHEDLP